MANEITERLLGARFSYDSGSSVSSGAESSSARALWATARQNWPVWLVGGATLINGLLGIVSVLAVH